MAVGNTAGCIRRVVALPGTTQMSTKELLTFLHTFLHSKLFIHSALRHALAEEAGEYRRIGALL